MGGQVNDDLMAGDGRAYVAGREQVDGHGHGSGGRQCRPLLRRTADAANLVSVGH